MSTEQNAEVNVEAAKAPRNFRTAIDIENFYRFVNENDLRKEAKVMLEMVFQKVMQQAKKKRKENIKNAKKNLH